MNNQSEKTLQGIDSPVLESGAGWDGCYHSVFVNLVNSFFANIMFQTRKSLTEIDPNIFYCSLSNEGEQQRENTEFKIQCSFHYLSCFLCFFISLFR